MKHNIRKMFVEEIRALILNAQKQAIRSVDFHRVQLYWGIGKRIVEEEQGGEDRATYGAYLIQKLSDELQVQFGSGYSIRQLETFRQFYRSFPIAHTLRAQLNWTQYKRLIRIKNEDKREYYILETIKNNWTARQMERQINSQLYERLLLSNDKEAVLAIARKEKLAEAPHEIIKDPIVLEFLGLKQQANYYEKDLEQAIITQLQAFLLELGNGFSFVSRQKRIHLEGDEFFVDLVFYNRLLRCFVLLEIKTHKLSHQDLGQLQMYVNYFDRIEKLEDENPTIGILLCASKNDSLVKFSLPKDNQHILASKYQLYLPTEAELLKKLKLELDTYEGES